MAARTKFERSENFLVVMANGDRYTILFTEVKGKILYQIQII
nr:hypothetical protein [Okeania sp. SIO2F4]